MKSIIIILISIAFSVAIVFTIQPMEIDYNEISEYDVIGVIPFDCAKHWDQIVEYHNSLPNYFQNDNAAIKAIVEQESLGTTFFKNSCASTVNDWAYKTQDVNSVWNNRISWEHLKQLEKEFLKK